MAVYSDEIAMALEMITEAGGLGTFSYPNNVGSDPDQPWHSEEGVEPLVSVPNIPAVVFPVGSVLNGRHSSYLTAEDIVPRAEDVAFVPAVALNIITRVPSGSFLELNGIKYSILKYDLIAPNGEEILFIFQLRR